MLVDPEHPAVVYTVHDVAVRYGAGFGGLEILGVGLTVAGLLGLGFFFLWSKRSRDHDIRRIIADAS